MFKSIQLKSWRQFEEIDINFHPKLTVLTGANCSGKTTVLNILGRHFGWDINIISTPKTDKKSGKLSFLTGWWDRFFGKKEGSENEAEKERLIGSIMYSDNQSAEIKIPKNVKQTYKISIVNQKSIEGLFIPSHRPNYIYQEINKIPTRPPTGSELFNNYSGEIRTRQIQGHSNTNLAPNYYIKEALVSLATFGYGNEVVVANEEARRIFEGFQEILKTVLPPILGFQRLSIEMPEVVLKTLSGDFSIDDLSGGVTAIIDLAWQIYTFSEMQQIADRKNFVVIIDEPENHLHPEMQRTLLINFLKAFPDVQFIVATHNPFIVTSIPESNVYALKFNENNKVTSTKLDLIDKSGSSNMILREVLGVSSALPLWVDERLNKIIKKYSSMKFDTETIKKFRGEMKEIGFDGVVPEALIAISNKIDDKVE